jgi:hypothetical protein
MDTIETSSSAGGGTVETARAAARAGLGPGAPGDTVREMISPSEARAWRGG